MGRLERQCLGNPLPVLNCGFQRSGGYISVGTLTAACPEARLYFQLVASVSFGAPPSQFRARVRYNGQIVATVTASNQTFPHVTSVCSGPIIPAGELFEVVVDDISWDGAEGQIGLVTVLVVAGRP